jgi:biopolymer transport protein ExbD/biopolymer transport protein TolR
MPKVMTAGSANRRPGRGRRTASTLAEINVVPLVDVMLVLLIIFMVTAPMIQRGIDVNLPVARRANQIEGQRLTVSIPLGYRENRIVYLNEEPVRADLLPERVRQGLEKSSQKWVYLRGDKGLTYGDLMDIVDQLKAAGVLTVGLETTQVRGSR